MHSHLIPKVNSKFLPNPFCLFGFSTSSCPSALLLGTFPLEFSIICRLRRGGRRRQIQYHPAVVFAIRLSSFPVQLSPLLLESISPAVATQALLVVATTPTAVNGDVCAGAHDRQKDGLTNGPARRSDRRADGGQRHERKIDADLSTPVALRRLSGSFSTSSDGLTV